MNENILVLLDPAAQHTNLVGEKPLHCCATMFPSRRGWRNELAFKNIQAFYFI